MMTILEFKAYGKAAQYKAIDEAIRTVKFLPNSCIRLWRDNKGTGKYDISKYSKVLAKEFFFANQYNISTKHGLVQGISHQYCSIVHRKDGYSYSL
ncbi:hypothetical protein [Moorena producens]|uniref:hypothetical protein n=1 Tax=Moorena producens TaxID=1155739 RepID=UPI001E4E069C